MGEGKQKRKGLRKSQVATSKVRGCLFLET